MSLTNKVLYDIDQTTDTTPAQKETARKNIGAYEDKTAAGGIPKSDLASDVQSSLGKADSSVQSVTANGQALTKSAAGAIDIPKATDTKWGVVQVVNELRDNQNVIPNSRVVKEAVDGLSAALQARATFWTVQEWQTQSAQPGDPSKIYYVGPKGAGNDQYDMYEWRTKTNSYVLTDESTISLDGYWHGAPDIVGEDTVAPFITSIEKNADDTVKYRTCSATVGDLGLPVFMDSGVVKEIELEKLFPIVRLTTPYEEVRALVEAGYRPILLPYDNEYGERYQITYTKFHYEPIGPEYIFTAIENERGYLPFFADKKIVAYSCQNIESETWIQLDEHLLPVIPEPNESDHDVGKVLTVSAQGRLYWAEPAGGNNVEVRAGTNNLHVTSADVNDQTIFTMSADYYHSSGNYAGTYTGPGTVIVDPTTMNLESTNSAYGYRDEYSESLIGSNTTAEWSMEFMGSWNSNNIPTDANYRLVKFSCRSPENIRDDMRVHIKFSIANGNNAFETRTLNADDLRKETYLAIPTGAGKISWQLGSDSSPSGYANNGYNIHVYAHSDDTRYIKGELAWKDRTYQYVDEQIETREPRLPVHSYAEKNKVLTVSGDNGELGWMSPLPETSGSQYLIGDNGTPKWRDREKLVYRSNSLGQHTVTQEDLDAKFIVLPIQTWNIPAPGIAIDAFLYFLVLDEAGYTAAGGATGHPLIGSVTTLSIGYWNDDNTWRGGLLEDISGSDLPYASYGHGSIRRTGVTTATNSTMDLYKMRGPAIRLNLNSEPSVGVGDKIKIGGTIIGIRIDGGLW